MTRIQGLLIDAEQVYFRHDGKRFFQAMQERYAVDVERIRAIYKRSPEVKQYKRGLMGGDRFWTFTCRELGIIATPSDIIDLMVQGYAEDEGLIGIMDELKETGTRFVMCTNNIKERLDALEGRFSFRQRFDAVITSYDAHLLKPSSLLFQKAAAAIDLPAQAILGIDDQVKNIRRMHRLGFKTHLYGDAAALREDIKHRYPYLLSSLIPQDTLRLS